MAKLFLNCATLLFCAHASANLLQPSSPNVVATTPPTDEEIAAAERQAVADIATPMVETVNTTEATITNAGFDALNDNQYFQWLDDRRAQWAAIADLWCDPYPDSAECNGADENQAVWHQAAQWQIDCIDGKPGADWCAKNDCLVDGLTTLAATNAGRDLKDYTIFGDPNERC